MCKQTPVTPSLCVLLSCMLFPLQALLAQDASTPLETNAVPPQSSERNIEQITVTGQRTLLSMRNTIDRMEEDMYRTFNDLNSSDDLDIFCISETRTTSHIIQRKCEPVFLTNLKKENAQSAVAQIRNAYTDEGLDFALLEYGLDFIESEKTLQSLASAQYEKLGQEMLRIAQENPEISAAMLRIGELKAEYEAARKQKFSSE